MAFHYLLVLHFLILFLLISSCRNAFSALSIVTDKEALISFKSQIAMDPPNVLSTWDHNTSPCNWTGVSCNKLLQRVVGLNLSGQSLTGSLSPHIGNLSFLTSLQLQSNKFIGSLPHQISNLHRLQLLNISFNSIGGTVPPNITRCKELRILDLMQNEILGRIPNDLNNLTKLQVLNLGRNHLFGSIPPSIGNVSSLVAINLGTNTLNGVIPNELSRLRNLKHLDLTIYNLTGTVPSSIYNMSSLVSLAVASNDLSGDLPYNVGVTLPNLLVFNFCLNKFTGTIPGSLHNLTNIQVIRMAHNYLHGKVPPGLGNLPYLQMYNIGFNKIVSSKDDGLSFLTSLTNSTRLNFLAIDGNLLEGVIPESIGNLSKSLAKLYMGGNKFSGSIPASIGQLSDLQLLNLSYNSISGEIPPEIGQLGELQMLGLAGNRLNGKIPSSLGNLQKLNKLDVSGNELVGTIPTTFGNFQNLLAMDLSNNMLNGSIPEGILNLPSLSTFLNLSRNFLSGPLPQEIGLLQSVATINLSDNRFSGNIPNSIGNCKSLEELFIAQNMLSGGIPETLGAVKGLEILDLYSNQLSGSVPRDLEKLLVLQSLNISFNNLEGELPTGGIFTNLSRVDMEGNKKLCFHFPCKKTRGLSRGRIILICVTITTAAIGVVCFTIGLLFFSRKEKSKIMEGPDSFKGEHQMVTYDELRLATGNFNQENLLGQGSFGMVYKGFLREGMAIAVKVLDNEFSGSFKSFLAECAALRHVRHQNLVKLITSCSSIDFKNMDFLALVYEFMSNGSLDDWIKGKRRNANGERLNILDRLNVAIDVACGINYLHHECENPVVHCDLKPSNVLLDEEMAAKIGDFGLARLLIERTGDQSISSTHVLKGSIGYIPPEYGMGIRPSTVGDVYSYGIMLLELFTGKNPTHGGFTGGLSLKKWVQTAFPTDVEQVLDPELLLHMKKTSHDDDEFIISQEAQLHCLITIIGIGLSCADDSPDGRISMRDALRKLQSVRDSVFKPEVNRGKVKF